MDEICKNTINCATHILQDIKDITAVKNIFVGISTGTTGSSLFARRLAFACISSQFQE